MISRIQQATDIVDVIAEHLSLQKKGKELVGLCPFHQDHRPSLYVNPVKQIFKCFACGAGGDVFKFIQLRENLDFPAAVERLAGRAGIKLEAFRPSDKKRADSAPAGDPKYVAKINTWALKLWQENLKDEHKGAPARQYLEQRKITGESAVQWGLGFAVDGWDDLVEKARPNKRISEKLLIEAGLAVTRDNGGCYDKFRNRLMFPIYDVTDRVIGFGGRTLGAEDAKYMNSPATVLFEKSNSLYGLNRARHEIVSSGTAVVVEGYTDVIMAHQFGCNNVIATLGTSFTDGHAMILRRYAKRIVLVFDNDIAGVEAANRALEVCLTRKIDIKLAFVAEGNDPCDFLLSSGTEAFERIVAEAVDVMEFKWQRLTEGLEGSDNLSDKRTVTEEFLRSVSAALLGGRIDVLSRGMMVNKLSKIIGLSSEQINRELGRLSGRVGRSQSYSVQNQKVVSGDLGDGFFTAQEDILEVLISEPELFSQVAGRVKAEDFKHPVLRQIAEVVFDALQKSQRPTISQLLTRFESVEAGSMITDLAFSEAKKGENKERLEKAVAVVEEYLKNDLRDRIKAGLKDNETETLRRVIKTLPRTNKRNPGMLAM
jgi:DNA primase